MTCSTSCRRSLAKAKACMFTSQEPQYTQKEPRVHCGAWGIFQKSAKARDAFSTRRSKTILESTVRRKENPYSIAAFVCQATVDGLSTATHGTDDIGHVCHTHGVTTAQGVLEGGKRAATGTESAPATGKEERIIKQRCDSAGGLGA